MQIIDRTVSSNLKYKIDLIEITKDNYCVRKTTSGWFGDKVEFYCLNYNGTDIMYDKLANEVTIGKYARCLLIYNATLLNMGIK